MVHFNVFICISNTEFFLGAPGVSRNKLKHIGGEMVYFIIFYCISNVHVSLGALGVGRNELKHIGGEMVHCNVFYCISDVHFFVGAPGVGRNELKRRLIESNPSHFKPCLPRKFFLFVHILFLISICPLQNQL